MNNFRMICGFIAVVLGLLWTQEHYNLKLSGGERKGAKVVSAMSKDRTPASQDDHESMIHSSGYRFPHAE